MQVLLFCDKISLLLRNFWAVIRKEKIFKKIFNFLKPFHLKTVLISENDKKAQLGKEKDMKKNWIKKVLAVAISACTLISTIGFDGTVVKAATYTTVSVDKEFVGKISELPEGGASKSYYSFTTDSTDSYYSVNLKAYNDSETGSVKYKIYDNEERTGEVVSDGSVGCNNYHEFDVAKGFKPNTQYYIEFTGSYVDKEPANFKCTIKKYSTDDYKDDQTALKKFAVGETQTGIMNHDEDVDYFTFTTDGTDSFYYMDLKAVCLMEGEGGHARVRIYSDKEFTNEIENVVIDSGRSGQYDLVKKLKPNTQYYVMVTAGWLDKIGEKLRYEIKINKNVDDYKDDKTALKKFAVGETQTGIMNHDEDVDYFTFTTDGTDSFYYMDLKAVCLMEGEGGHARVRIYSDKEFTNEIENVVIDSGRSGQYDLVKKLKPNTQYYVKVTAGWIDKIGELIKYEIKINKNVDDYKDNPTALKKFSVGATQTGIMNHDEDVDYFTFTTDKTDSFYYMNLKTVSLMAGEGGHARVRIYSDKEFTNEIYNVAVDSGTSRKCDLEKKLKPNTQYYVMVTAGWLDKIGEKLRYEIKITKTVDDVKDTADKAKTLTLNKSYSQKIENNSDVDIFKVKTANFTDYKIVLKSTSTKGSIQLSIYSDKDLTNRVSSVYLSGKSAINAYSASIKLTPYKTYYFKVNGAADSKYTIGLNAKAPSNSAKSQLIKKKKCVTISWSRINKATGYEVFRATKNGKYKRIAVIKSAKTVKWIDKNVKKGTTYKYKVRAYAKVKGKTYYSAFSAEKSVKVK